MENKKEKKGSSKLKLTVTLVVLTFCCFAGGIILGKLVGKPGGDSAGSSPKEKIVFLVTIFVSAVVSYILSLIIHEGGHLVFGLATGYKFLSFRVGSLTLVKKDGKFAWKRFSIQGTGGQCVLMPPEDTEPEKAPFLFYHLGGGLVNLISAAIFLPISGVLSSGIPKTAMMVFGMLSLVQGLTNLIPMKIQIPNDGYNIFMMLRHPADRAAIYKSLYLNGLLYRGMTPHEIPAELLELGDSGFYKTVGMVLKAGAALDSHDYETAEKLFAECAEDDSIPVYNLESRAELMFCKVMNGAPAGEIDELYDKELQNYIKAAAKNMISKRRLMYAYHLLFKHDPAAARKEYEAAMKMKDTYPIEGELRSELGLIEAVRERAE